ncbi:MAG: sugar transferase [Endomicrobiales bacterium]|nr:sugar transferase [Endomicrobiales bacterium]
MRISRSQITIVSILILADVLSVCLSLYFAYNFRFFSFFSEYVPVTKGVPDWFFYKSGLFFVIPLWFFIFYKNGLYKIYFLPLLDELLRIARSVTLGMFFIVIASFFYREFSYSRMTFLLFWVFSITFLFAYREVFKFLARFFIRYLKFYDRVLVVGRENKLIKAIIKKHPNMQVTFCPSPNESEMEKVKRTVLEKDISQVIFVSHEWSETKIFDLYDWCEHRSIDLKFLPDMVQLCRGEVVIDSSLGLPIFHLRPVALSGFNFIFKRIVDVVISIIALSFTWPMLFLLAVLIKVDSSGPFLYHHKRMGYRGRVFEFYKFRTMVMNADALLEKYRHKSERSGPVFKMSNDPRVTRIGKLLRRYSIDEIPQVINVLKGDMSIVGPRPQVLWEASVYDEWAKRRLRILPGITGLWQISGRASLSYKEMIDLDIFYIENWSIGLDLQILLKTIPAIFSKEGAY